jgi:hypothetical protein
MHEDMVRKPVLDAQRSTVKARIAVVAPCLIHIVCGEDNSFPQGPIVKQQQGSIDPFEPVVPKDVKYSRFGGGGVVDQAAIARQEPAELFREAGAWPQISVQVEEAHLGLVAEFGEIEIVAPDEV